MAWAGCGCPAGAFTAAKQATKRAAFQLHVLISLFPHYKLDGEARIAMHIV
jgi:hypothetical protein